MGKRMKRNPHKHVHQDSNFYGSFAEIGAGQEAGKHNAPPSVRLGVCAEPHFRDHCAGRHF